MTEQLGERLIDALSRSDFATVRSLFHPDVHLRGLTPGRFDEAYGEDAIGQVVDIFKAWFFEDDDVLSGVAWCDARAVGNGGRYKLSFGLRGKSPGMSDWYGEKNLRDVAADADWVVEQEAYYEVDDGLIKWMIVLCGGYHPADEVDGG